jgi:hypothetical protein
MLHAVAFRQHCVAFWIRRDIAAGMIHLQRRAAEALKAGLTTVQEAIRVLRIPTRLA